MNDGGRAERTGVTGRNWAEPAGTPAERGQIMIIGALVMSMLFVALAVGVNAGLYAGVMATDTSADDTADAAQAYQQTALALTNSLEYVNANHATDHVALTRNLTATLESTERALADHYATTGAFYEMSPPATTNRTEIVHDNASRNFTDATGATGWTLIDGVDSTAAFGIVVQRDGLELPKSADRFRLSITNGSVTVELRLAHDRDTGDIKLEVTTPTGSNTCKQQNETATVDLLTGSLAGAHCPNLAFEETVDGPFQVRYANADNATGEYRLNVTGANAAPATSYEDGTGSPRATVSIAAATVEYAYETDGIRHGSNVTTP